MAVPVAAGTQRGRDGGDVLAAAQLRLHQERELGEQLLQQQEVRRAKQFQSRAAPAHAAQALLGVQASGILLGGVSGCRLALLS